MINIKKYINPFWIILLVTIISVIANLWFFGQKWLANERQKYLNSGAIQAENNLKYLNSGAFQMREQIFNIAKQQGWIIIGNNAGETIKLEIAK